MKRLRNATLLLLAMIPPLCTSCQRAAQPVTPQRTSGDHAVNDRNLGPGADDEHLGEPEQKQTPAQHP